jgi:hypothetical protein
MADDDDLGMSTSRHGKRESKVFFFFAEQVTFQLSHAGYFWTVKTEAGWGIISY